MRDRIAAYGLALGLMAALCFSACASGGSGVTPPETHYTVGGTVTGLSGTGLVLQDNGGNNLTVSANGGFTFTSSLLIGSAYDVTILTQPSSPTQACSVTNGSGMGNANVTNVVVTCTNVYTIGGTVAGLAGTGLVLQNNGGDSLVVGGTNFTFPTALASGNTYNVTVLTQPSSPAQNCVVTNGSGTANANVTNVTVTCTTIVFYTIGGTVSGLASGTSATLWNVGDVLAITANGSFTFPTALAAGSGYDVVVHTQPFNATCTVANGIGTATANVTNIHVTCASKLKALYRFGAAPDGNDPEASLVFDSSGNLYGTTLHGGTIGNGTVFKLTPSGGLWTETVIDSFCHLANCADGGAPQGNLIFDAAGNLYGTTSQGGAYSGGVVFEMTPQSDGTWTYSVLHSFGNGTDGSAPFGGVIFDSLGNLYGTTVAGGTTTTFCAGGCGIAYELSPGSGGPWAETVLYDFCSETSCTDGNAPVGSLVFDNAGNLYGATGYGGTPSPDAEGTVFELTPSGNGQWTHTVMHSFTGTRGDGYSPNGGLTLTYVQSSVVLYGTTGFGGCCGNNGLLYAAEQSLGATPPWIALQVYGFCEQAQCSDGSSPNAGLVLDRFGVIYGTTSQGGAPRSWGVVFSSGGQGSETVIYTFQAGTDGYGPTAGLIMDAAGNLYGTAQGGGATGSGNGVVFEVTP